LVFPLPQVQSSVKVSRTSLEQKATSNESLSKKEGFATPLQIGFPSKSESSVNFQSRGSNGSKKSTGSSRNVNDLKSISESGKLTKLPAVIGFPTSASGSSLSGMNRSGSRELNSAEDYKKNSLSNVNAPAKIPTVVEEPQLRLELRQHQSTTRSPPTSTSSGVFYGSMSTSSKNDSSITSPTPRAQNESAWPTSNPVARQSKEFPGSKRLETIVDDGRTSRVRTNSSASEAPQQHVRGERSGSIAGSIKSSRPSKAESAEEMLQKLRAGASTKIGGQQNSQQTMVEKSMSMSSDVGYRKTSVGTSAGSSFNPSGLKTLAESPHLPSSRVPQRGPADKFSISPKNSDLSLVENSPLSPKSNAAEQLKPVVTTGSPIPRSPFASSVSPTATSHLRSASPFAPKADRSGSVGSDTKQGRTLSTGQASGRPSFTRNVFSGSITTTVTFTQPALSNPSSGQTNFKRPIDDNRPPNSLGFRPNPALTIKEQSSAGTSERGSVTEAVTDGMYDDFNPYAVSGDIHVVQCFPNGDGLFKLIPNWDLESNFKA
jgi:hypothetical protein